MDARWYTSARRFPQLIGRTPDGSKLPGGPYTIPQLVVAGVMAFVLWHTTGAWARFGLITNIVLGGGLLFGSVWLTGRLPYNMRNPLVVMAGWLSAAERATGAAGAPIVKLRKPRLPTGGQVLMITPNVPDGGDPSVGDELLIDDLLDEQPATTAAPLPRPVNPLPDPVSPAAPCLTGIQRLLAAAGPTPTQ